MPIIGAILPPVTHLTLDFLDSFQHSRVYGVLCNPSGVIMILAMLFLTWQILANTLPASFTIPRSVYIALTRHLIF